MPSFRIALVKPIVLLHHPRLCNLDPEPAVLRISVPLGGHNPSNGVEMFLRFLGQSREPLILDLLRGVVVYLLFKCSFGFCLTRV